MNSINTRRNNRGWVRIWESTWFYPVMFVTVSRIVISAIALAAVNFLPLSETMFRKDLVVLTPYTLPGVWLRYDAGYYLNIAMNGYTHSGVDNNFFPAYPFFMLLFSGGTSLQGTVWAGFLISNLAFIAAALILWDQVRQVYGKPIAHNTLLTLTLFPTAFFFSAIYTESLFLFLAVLVYYFSRREKYLAAGVCVSLASLTRVTGILLALIPLVDLLSRKAPRQWIKLALVGLVSGLGLAGMMLYQWTVLGSPVAFVQAQASTMGRSITPPWTTLLDSVFVVITPSVNWFMRMVTLQDLSFLLLFAILGVLAARWLPRGLFAYMLASVVLLSVSHGPNQYGVYSDSRYVLNLFPGFIVLGMLLARMGKFKWLFWVSSTVLVVFMTAWWVTGHWVA